MAAKSMVSEILKVICASVLLLFTFGTAFGQAPPEVSFFARRDFPVGYSSTLNSIAVGDFNGDGKLDVVVADSAGGGTIAWVFLGNGDGTFQSPLAVVDNGGASAYQVEVGDFNNDGRLDLIFGYTVNYSSAPIYLNVMLGNGDGTFSGGGTTQPDVQPATTGDFTFGDFNHDGKPDLAVIGPLPGNGEYVVSIMSGNGDGTFQALGVNTPYPQGVGPIRAADFNGDGKLDIVVGCGNCPTPNISVLLGNGDGTLQSALETPLGNSVDAAFPLLVGDFNADGELDVAFGNMVLLGNGDGKFGTPLLLPSSVGGPVLAVGDFNGDGKLDLVAGNQYEEWILLGQGDGTFRQSAVFFPQDFAPDLLPSLALGDFNGDGKLDLALALQPNPYYGPPGFISVGLGQGDGTFEMETDLLPPQYYPGWAAIGDVNNDGIPDLVSGGDQLEVLLGNGNGSFRKIVLPTQWGASYVAIGDLNKDGKLDLVVPATANDSFAVFLGNGDGTFKPEVDYVAKLGQVYLGDVNNDGNLDIVTSAGQVFLGKGDGTFGSPLFFAVPGSLMAEPDFKRNGDSTQGVGGMLALADFNQDGKLDIAQISPPYYVSVELGNGDGTFGSPMEYGAVNPESIAVGDVNRDGKLDLVTAGGYKDQLSVLLGNGDGTFSGGSVSVPGTSPASVSIADVNGDGNPDLIVANGNQSDVSVLLGNGDATFQPPVTFGTQSIGGGQLTFADLTGDGSLDVVVNGLSILFNRPAGAAVTLSSGALAFGNQEVETASGVGAVTLNNIGRSALTIGSIAIIGAQAGDFSQTNNCDSSVGAGDSCKINVTFTPSATAARNATLQVADNAPHSPQLVALSGTGVSLGLGIAAGGSNSATVAAGQTANYNLTIGGGGVSGTATLSCTGAPQGASCMLPGSVNVSASSATPIGVSVSTMSRTMSALAPSGLRPARWGWAMGVLGLVMLPGWFGRRTGRRGRRSLPLLLLLLVCSCGGGSSSGSQTNPNGTPAGTYPLQVMAKSGSMNQSIQLTLIVQ